MQFNILTPILENLRLRAVRRDPSYIAKIENPSVKVQLAAIDDNPLLILNINNPSVPVCIAAVQNRFGDIGNINLDSGVIDSTIKLFLHICDIENDYGNFKYSHLKDYVESDIWREQQLSEVLQEFKKEVLLVDEESKGIIQFANPELDLSSKLTVENDDFAKMRAVRNDPTLILDMLNPTAKICLEAIKAKFGDIGGIINSSDIIKPTIQLFTRVAEIENNYKSMIKEENVSVDLWKKDQLSEVLKGFKEEVTNIKYLSSNLYHMSKTGDIRLNELKDCRYDQFINEHFSSEYKELCSWIADTDPDKKHLYDLEGKIRLKAGELLEEKGLLPLGSIEKELADEGLHVQRLRDSYPKEVPANDQNMDARLLDAASKGDYQKMVSLKEQGYQPSQEVVKSLSNSFPESTLVAVQNIFSMEQPAHGDMKLVQSEANGKGMKYHVVSGAEQSL